MSSPSPQPASSAELTAKDVSGATTSIPTPTRVRVLTIEEQLKLTLTSMAEKDPAFLSNLMQPQTPASAVDGAQSSSSTAGKKSGELHSLPPPSPPPPPPPPFLSLHALVSVESAFCSFSVQICSAVSKKKQKQKKTTTYHSG